MIPSDLSSFVESPLAIDIVRWRGLAADARAAEESRRRAVLAVVRGVGEVPGAVFAAGAGRQSLGMAIRAGERAACHRVRRGTGQPALCASCRAARPGDRRSDSRRLPACALWLCGVAIGVGLLAAMVAIRSAIARRAARRYRSICRSPRCPLAGRLEPGVFGILRPVLLLPEGITDRLTPAQLEAVIAHELCHVRRRDNLTAAIHMVVETVFWFHPLVWWIRARLVEERERACDEEVLRAGRPARLCRRDSERLQVLSGIAAGVRCRSDRRRI